MRNLDIKSCSMVLFVWTRTLGPNSSLTFFIIFTVNSVILPPYCIHLQNPLGSYIDSTIGK